MEHLPEMCSKPLSRFKAELKQKGAFPSFEDAFVPIYAHFMKKNHELLFTKIHKNWQKLRLGRCVEFNLVWNRGTKFGLETNGRTESVLMGLPSKANWKYVCKP